MSKIERIAEIIALILQVSGGELVSRTRLVKILYLLDTIQHRKNNLYYFSGIRYKRYYSGPYSKDIEDGITLLVNGGHLKVIQEQSEEGNIIERFVLRNIPFFGQLKDTEKIQIREYLLPLTKVSVKELVALSCATQEFKEAEFGEELRFTK